MKNKVFWLVVSCFMVLALVLASCGPAVTEEEEEEEGPEMVRDSLGGLVEKPKYGGVFTYLAGAPNNFDECFSHITTCPSLSHTNELLLSNDWTRGPTGTGEATFMYNIVPELLIGVLAESWDLDPVAGITTLYIRKGVHFALDPDSEASRLVNGRELTADDVVFSLERSLTIPTARNFQFAQYIESVTALDKWTVVIEFEGTKTSEIWPIMTSHTRMVAREVIDKYGDLQDWRNSVGTGAFILTDYVAQSSLTFTRNPNYWQNDPFHPDNQLPYLDGMTHLIIADYSTQLAALRTHKIDWLGVGWEDVDIMKNSNPELKYARYLSASSVSIHWRLDKPELPWYDLRVRRALSMAIDHQLIADVYYGGNAELLNWPVQPIAEFSDFYTPLEELPEDVRELFEYHPDKAKQLLAEAGYPDGFKADIICSAGAVDILSIVKDSWENIGVELILSVREAGILAAIRYSNHNFPEMLYSGIHGQLPFRFIWERVGSMHNVSQVDDARMNAAIDAIDAVAYDIPKRNQLMQEIVPYMYSQAWHLQLPIPFSCRFWTPWVKGYSGEWNIGLSDYLSPFKFIWYDQDLKEEMTGER